MKKIFALLSMGVLSLALFGMECGSGSAFDTFATGNLNGANEVPPVETPSTGTFVLQLHTSEDRGRLTVNSNIPTGAVTGAHLHLGARTANGPVVVDLMPGGQSSFSYDFGGPELMLNSGITTWSQFLVTLQEGSIYINIHTEAHPAGYIRGQVVRT